MLNSILDTILGCSHRKTTFPLTRGGKAHGAYVACLECGAELTYDWNEMRIVGPVARAHSEATLTPATR